MFYTIYRISHNETGSQYIGKHQTKDLNDGYMGSGKYLKRAFQKYGLENFTKEILHVYDTEAEMNAKEAELVTEEFCQRKDTYNICSGGKGGFSYINETVMAVKTFKNKEIAKAASKLANERLKYLREHDKDWVEKRKISDARAACLSKERMLKDNIAKRPEVKEKLKMSWTPERRAKQAELCRARNVLRKLKNLDVRKL